MSRSDLFWLLLMSGMMVISAGTHWRHDRPIALLLLLIPLVGWIAIAFGR